MRYIQLRVDLIDAPRRLGHVEVELPVRPNTTASFTTPLWQCGTHMPSGPVARIAGLYFTANNGRQSTTLKWRRDVTERHIYHVDIPSGVTTVRASFDAVMKSLLTRRMAMVRWEEFMMHPAHAPVARVPIQATIRIPGDWDYAATLRTETDEHSTATNGAQHRTIAFAAVSAERLEDSPVLIGQHLSQLNITADGRHQLCVAFSEPELTRMIPQDRLDKLARLISEATLIFGPGPYHQYKFMSLSSDIFLSGEQRLVAGGLEHAESTTIFTTSRALADDALFDWISAVFSHEFVHVWNGKFRRPAGHVPADFSSPLDGTLLWVYEGLTHYYGYVLAARAGLMAYPTVRDRLAVAAADMQHQCGRAWRSTEDTATGMALKASATARDTPWNSYLRDTDYYDEGVLLWLDADTLIRERTGGAKSLDDFARCFFDTRGATHPLVVPYTLDEVVSTLTKTLVYDWAGFFRERVQTPQAQVNTAGFERAGYRFGYAGEPEVVSPVPAAQRRHAVWLSLGVRVAEDGTLADVRRFSRADKAGLAPTQKITHVNGEEYSLDALAAAMTAVRGQEDGKVRLRLAGDEESWDAAVGHSTGLLYPTLERRNGRDMLLDIFAPRAAKE